MPTLPLPAGGAALNGGDLPVSSGADVLSQMADTHRLPVTAPVRDALNEADACIHVAYQDEVASLIAQQDARTASGDALRKIASEHGITPAQNESDSALRLRIFGTIKVVAPQAIVDVVNALLAPYTTVQCQLVEPEMDGMFITDGTAAYDGAFINNPGSYSSPSYPDRFYPDDAALNGGFKLTNNDPMTAIVANGKPRTFHLILPELSATDADFMFVIDDMSPTGATEGLFLFDGAQDTLADVGSNNFAFNTAFLSDEVYNQIVAAVDSMKGQGMTWSAYVDPFMV